MPNEDGNNSVDFDNDESLSNHQQFSGILNMERRQSVINRKNSADDKMDVYSTIKNFERLPFTSIRVAHEDLMESEANENQYDISYDMEQSHMSKESALDSKHTVFQD